MNRVREVMRRKWSDEISKRDGEGSRVACVARHKFVKFGRCELSRSPVRVESCNAAWVSRALRFRSHHDNPDAPNPPALRSLDGSSDTTSHSTRAWWRTTN